MMTGALCFLSIYSIVKASIRSRAVSVYKTVFEEVPQE